MKSGLLIISMIAITMALSGCSNNEDNTVDPWSGEIRLASGVTVQTRAMYELDTKIAAGEQVAVWVYKHNTEDALHENNVLTADGNNGFTGGTPMTYPADANVDIYAIHTNGTLSNTFPTTVITHSVAADQSTAQKYAPCDLLYAIKTDQARQASVVVLPFYHILSKVEVALKSGNGAPDLTGATVTIESTKLKANFTPSKTADMTSVTVRAGMVAETAIDNPVAPISIATSVTTNDFATGTQYAEAIVVPQTIAAEAAFIKVTLASSSTPLIYKIPTAGLIIESGKKYIYKIIVNLSGLSVSAQIEDWAPVEKTGSAEID